MKRIKKIKNFILNNDDSAVKAGMYFIVCNIVLRGISFLSAPVFTRVMDRESYGLYSNYTAWVNTLFPLVTLDLSASINRSKYDFGEDNNQFLSSVLLFSSIFTIIIYFFFEWKHDLAEYLFSLDIKYIRVMFLVLLTMAASAYQQQQYNMYRKYRIYVFYALLTGISTILLSMILVITNSNKFNARLIGASIPAIIINVFIYFNILYKGRKFSLKYVKYALLISIPLIPSALSTILLSSSDQIIITKYCGADQTALYAVAYTISSIAGIIWYSLNQAWGPWFYDHLYAGKLKEIQRGSRMFTLIYSFLIIGVMLLAPEIIYIIGGEKYSEAKWVMPPVVLAMVCQFFYAFYFNVEYYYKKSIIISTGTLLAAMVNILLNIYFVPIYGYIAAAYTTLVGYIIMMIYHYLIVTFYIKRTDIYNNKFFGAILVSLFLIQLIIGFTYNANLIRYVMILVYMIVFCIMLYNNRKVIVSYLSHNKLG